MTENSLSRRDFIKASLAAAVGGLELITGCATTETAKSSKMEAVPASVKAEPVVYQRLADKKVQAPENGCLVGFRREYVRYYAAGHDNIVKLISQSNSVDEAQQALEKNNWKKTVKLREAVDDCTKYYPKHLGRNPAIFVLYDTPKLFLGFPTIESEPLADKEVIPYINAWPNFGARGSLRLSLSEIAKGKHDKYIHNFAEGAKRYGKNHGGVFMTTMEESNGYWYYWGQNSNFIPAWRHIWQIFEDQGANQYATWVWEASSTEPHRRRPIHSPEMYYPGDKYVDWIGLSAFSKKGMDSDGMVFEALVGNTYEAMRKNHPNKPIMQAEFGKSQDGSQPRWLQNAYNSIKTMPGMKAAIYYDNITNVPGTYDDKTLSQKSLQTLKEIFKDPYFIMAK